MPGLRQEVFIMVFVSKKAVKELALTTNAQRVNSMSREELLKIREKEHPTLLVSSFSINGHTTSSLYFTHTGKFYFEEGVRGAF